MTAPDRVAVEAAVAEMHEWVKDAHDEDLIELEARTLRTVLAELERLGRERAALLASEAAQVLETCPDCGHWVASHYTGDGVRVGCALCDCGRSVGDLAARDEREAAATDKRTPDEWCREYGIDIIDPDGWRSKSAPAWDEPITLADFYDRAIQSTLRNVPSIDWERFGRDTKASQ